MKTFYDYYTSINQNKQETEKTLNANWWTKDILLLPGMPLILSYTD
jgi:hypothetical protein